MSRLNMGFARFVWTYVVCPLIATVDGAVDAMRRWHASALDGCYHKVVVYDFESARSLNAYDYSFGPWNAVRVLAMSMLDPDRAWLVRRQRRAETTHREAGSSGAEEVMVGVYADERGKRTVHILPLFREALPLSCAQPDDKARDVIADVVYCTVGDDNIDVADAVEAVGWMLHDNVAWTCRQMIQVLSAAFPRHRNLRRASSAVAQDVHIAVMMRVDGAFVERTLGASDLLAIRVGPSTAAADADWDNEALFEDA